MIPSKKKSRKKSENLPLYRYLPGLIACTLLTLLFTGCATTGSNRMIFHGGDIVTMSDKSSGAVEAVFVENGKIVSTGTKDEMLKHRRDDTRMIDLQGKTLMPGFIAVHTHPDISAYLLHSTPDLFPKLIENGDDFFKICGMKIWYDGSPYTGSMYIREPYLNSELMLKGLKIPANHRGQTVIGRQEFFDAVKKYHELGWQVSVHSQGDRSTQEVLEVFDRIQSESPTKHLRHRIEHGVLLPPELLGKMKRLGITPSFHINHLYYYGKALRDDILGPERASKMLPVGSTGKAGLYYSLHADAPMYPEEPLSLLQTAVTRKTREGEIIGLHEAISVTDGLKALTIYAAWQINMEKKIGSIEPGKYADLIILNRNPLKVKPESLREIQVLNTFVNGNEVWSRGK